MIPQTQASMNWQDYLHIVLERRWWIVLPTFVIWVGACVVAWLIPASYRSETQILVQPQQVPEQFVAPNITPDMQQRLQTMTQQILSRTRLQTIINTLQLYPDLRGREVSDDLLDRMRKDIKIDAMSNPEHKGQLTSFKISYSAPTPQLAQKVTSELSNLFIQENLRERKELAENTTAFLDSELKDARDKLDLLEKRIRDFKSSNLGELPGQTQSNLQILVGLQASLQEANAALSRAEQQKMYLTSMLTQYPQSTTDDKSDPNDVPPAMAQELANMQSELAALKAKYTESHPDVQRLKQKIAETEKMISASKSGGKGTRKLPARTDVNPAVQLSSQLRATELEISSRKKEIEQLRRQIDSYQARLNQTPVREQQLADLSRDYDQSRADYEALLKKKNQSELATNLEKQQQGQQFRILDPPSLPDKPDSPNRFRFSVMGLAAGLCLGFGLVFGFEFLRPLIRSRSDLEAAVKAAVLVEVPVLLTPMEQHRATTRRWRDWVFITAMALVVVAGNAYTWIKS
jgi:protein tyrosine kinase modulator